MQEDINRRKFIHTSVLTGVGLSLFPALTAMNVGRNKKAFAGYTVKNVSPGKRIGIIGLDTSHSTAFTEGLNSVTADAAYEGYKIVAAFPQGSSTIKSSYERIPAYTEAVKKSGVEIVGSIAELLNKADVIMLETNDGRPHAAQALEVMKAGKTLFIDKPVAGTLADTITIYEAAKHFNVPVFSSSSLRFATNVQATATGKTAGRILGADTYSPAPLESTHPDFFWYGIHGIEMLVTVMGKGCKQVSRIHAPDTDLVTGVWNDNRIGSFRGTRTGKNEYGGTAFGETEVVHLGPYSGYEGLLKEVIKFFRTGISPVSDEETLEIYAFMEAADESKRNGGVPILLNDVMKKAMAEKRSINW